MSGFLDWLSRLGRSQAARQAERDIDAIARELFLELRDRPEPHDPKPMTDDLVSRGLAKRREPTEEHLRQLRGRIKGLTEQQRKVVKLNSIDRLTYKQIAARLGITNHVALRELSAAMHALSMPGLHR